MHFDGVRCVFRRFYRISGVFTRLFFSRVSVFFYVAAESKAEKALDVESADAEAPEQEAKASRRDPEVAASGSRSRRLDFWVCSRMLKTRWCAHSYSVHFCVLGGRLTHSWLDGPA